MKALLISSLTAAIAATVGVALTQDIAIQSGTPAIEQSEFISQSYTYRRYNSGTGRRDILS